MCFDVYRYGRANERSVCAGLVFFFTSGFPPGPEAGARRTVQLQRPLTRGQTYMGRRPPDSPRRRGGGRVYPYGELSEITVSFLHPRVVYPSHPPRISLVWGGGGGGSGPSTLLGKGVPDATCPPEEVEEGVDPPPYRPVRIGGGVKEGPTPPSEKSTTSPIPTPLLAIPA